jgi:integrase
MERSVNYVPALVTAVSGCRPAELRQGVALSIVDGRLRVDIRGAKVGPGRGQERRSFQYALPSPYPPINDLAGIVAQAGGALTVSIKNPSSFSSALVYYGRAAFPRSTRRITPYSLRHFFASDLKLNCPDPDDVSRALGHQADRTRSSYGQAQQGRADGLAPSDIDATHAVRHVRSDPRGGPGARFR